LKLNQSIQDHHLTENLVLPKDALRQLDALRFSVMQYFNLVPVEEIARHYLPEHFDTRVFHIAPKPKGFVNRQNWGFLLKTTATNLAINDQLSTATPRQQDQDK